MTNINKIAGGFLEEANEASPITQIYIPLLDEGTDVARPTEAKAGGPHEFLVLPTPDYDPELEHWEFPPGSVVRCTVKRRDDGDILVAEKRLR